MNERHKPPRYGEEDNLSDSSFVDLNEEQLYLRASETHSVSQFMMAADQHQRVGEASVLLRRPTNSTDMVFVLMDIWRPELEMNIDDDDIPLKSGRIVDFVDNDILFHYDEHMRRLLALIVHGKAGFVAKTASVDAMTWLGTLDVVLHYPAYNPNQLWGWMFDLFKFTDANIQSSGLRGIRNLLQNPDYREFFGQKDNHVLILSFIDDGAANIKHADAYVFEMYRCLLDAGGENVPGLNQFLEMLLRRIATATLSKSAKIEGIGCIETCITATHDGSFIQKLLQEGHLYAWIGSDDDDILSKGLELLTEVYINIPPEKKNEMINDVIGTNNTMEKLFGSLSYGRSELETSILTLMHNIALQLPNAFYDDYLDDAWLPFQIVLEQGSEANKQLVMNIIHTIAMMDGSVPKHKPLPLPSREKAFIELMATQLSGMSLDILYFIWTCYDDFLPWLTEVGIASSLLSALTDQEWTATRNNANRIHRFLMELAERAKDPRVDFGRCLFLFMKTALDAPSSPHSTQCLTIGLEVLDCLSLLGSVEISSWLIEEGLITFLNDLMSSTGRISQLNNLHHLECLLLNTFRICNRENLSGTVHEGAFYKLFVSVLDAAKVLGVQSVTTLLDVFRTKTEGKMFFTETSDAPNSITAQGLSVEGLGVIKVLLTAWTPADCVSFLESLLWVLLRCALQNRLASQAIEDAKVLEAFVELLDKLVPTEMSATTKRIIMRCLEIGATTFHKKLSQLIITSGPGVIDHLWCLVMSHGCGGSSMSSKNILELVKTVSLNNGGLNENAQMVYVMKENEDLRRSVAHLTAIIREKESKIKALQQNQAGAQESVVKPAGPSRQPSPQKNVSMTVELETTVRRLKRVVNEKETSLADTISSIEHLKAEIRNREEAYNELTDIVDAQYDKIAAYEAILNAEGFALKE